MEYMEILVSFNFGQFFSHVEPVRFIVIDQDVGEDELPRARERLIDDRIIVGIHVGDDAEDALLYIHRIGNPVLAFADIGDVVAYNALARHHSCGGFPAGAGECSGEVGGAVLSLRFDPHDEHVLGQPVLVVGAVDGQPQGQLFQPYAVSGTFQASANRAVRLSFHLLGVRT